MSIKILSNDPHCKYVRELREWYKAHHICIDCGIEPAYKGRTRCLLCADKNAECSRKCREKRYYTESRYADNRRKKRLYDLRVAFGVCTKCGKRDAEPGHKTCFTCRAKENQRLTDIRRAKGIFPRDEYSGLCYMCNKRPPAKGKRFCPVCIETVSKNIAKGRVKSRANNKNHIWRAYSNSDAAKINARKRDYLQQEAENER